MCELRIAACAVLAVLALAGCGDEKSSGPPATQAGNGLSVELPADWQLARTNLTPDLSEPRQVLAAANYPLRYRPHRCAHIPVSALEDLGQSGAFVELQERRVVADPTEFPLRPQEFGVDRGDPSEAADCVSKKTRMEERVFTFTDHGRHFYARVASGPAASEATRNEAWELLQSVKVEGR